jgi:hypothetical protein
MAKIFVWQSLYLKPTHALFVKYTHIQIQNFKLLKMFLKHLINPLSPELHPICYLLALLAHDFLHVSRIRVKSLTFRLLMSYIWSTYS